MILKLKNWKVFAICSCGMMVKLDLIYSTNKVLPQEIWELFLRVTLLVFLQHLIGKDKEKLGANTRRDGNKKKGEKQEKEKHKTYLVGPNGWERNVSIKLTKHCQPDVLCVTSERASEMF